MTAGDERALARARADVAARRREVEVQQRACLQAVADELAVQFQPVARAIAVDGLRSGWLRSEGAPRLLADLDDAILAVATTLRAAADEIHWPDRREGFATIESLDVAPAVHYFLVTHLEPLIETMHQHGYDERREGRPARRLLSPRPLFDVHGFAALAESLHRLGDAEAALAEQERDDEVAKLRSLWDLSDDPSRWAR